MARARNIKPAIMDNEILADLEPLTRLLFIYLWMLADREGRLEDRPKRIAAQALPYDRSADVDAMLADLDRAGFIKRYKRAGLSCIQILKFSEHQTPHVRESVSCLPPMVGGTTEAVPEHNLGSAEASPRSPDSLIPDSLIPDSKAERAARFERFWSAYPKKKSKGQAESAWKKINPDEQLTERIIAAVEQAKTQAEWQKDGGQFIPYPATWLNAKGWEDEVAAGARHDDGWVTK